jgi:hypothetical protein
VQHAQRACSVARNECCQELREHQGLPGGTVAQRSAQFAATTQSLTLAGRMRDGELYTCWARVRLVLHAYPTEYSRERVGVLRVRVTE